MKTRICSVVVFLVVFDLVSCNRDTRHYNQHDQVVGYHGGGTHDARNHDSHHIGQSSTRFIEDQRNHFGGGHSNNQGNPHGFLHNNGRNQHVNHQERHQPHHSNYGISSHQNPGNHHGLNNHQNINHNQGHHQNFNNQENLRHNQGNHQNFNNHQDHIRHNHGNHQNFSHHQGNIDKHLLNHTNRDIHQGNSGLHSGHSQNHNSNFGHNQGHFQNNRNFNQNNRSFNQTNLSNSSHLSINSSKPLFTPNLDQLGVHSRSNFDNRTHAPLHTSTNVFSVQPTVNRTANLTKEARDAALHDFTEFRLPLITAPQRSCPDGQRRDRFNNCRQIF